MMKAARTNASRGDSLRDLVNRAENDRQCSQKKSRNIRKVGMCGTAASVDMGCRNVHAAREVSAGKRCRLKLAEPVRLRLALHSRITRPAETCSLLVSARLELISICLAAS